MATNCIGTLPRCLLSKYLLGKNNLHYPRQRTSQLGHWSQEHPFCSPGLQSWNSRILWVNLQRVQTSGKHTRKERAGIKPTGLIPGSVAAENFGTTSKTSCFSLDDLWVIAQGYVSGWKDGPNTKPCPKLSVHQSKKSSFLWRCQPFNRLQLSKSRHWKPRNIRSVTHLSLGEFLKYFTHG